MDRWMSHCQHTSYEAISIIPNDFSYTMNWSDSGSIKITGNHQDQLINKKFLEIIAPIFGVITEEKYILKYEEKNTFATQELWPFRFIMIFFSITFISLILVEIVWVLTSWLVYIGLIVYFLYREVSKNKKIQKIKNALKDIKTNNIQIGLPEIIASNEEKRRYFLWKKYPSIPEEARWFSLLKSYNIFSLITMYYIVILIIIFAYIWIYLSEKSYAAIAFAFSVIWIATLLALFITIGIHYFYKLYAQLYNCIQNKKIITIEGDISPTTQSDIGKWSLLSGKIEKLWI